MNTITLATTQEQLHEDFRSLEKDIAYMLTEENLKANKMEWIDNVLTAINLSINCSEMNEDKAIFIYMMLNAVRTLINSKHKK